MKKTALALLCALVLLFTACAREEKPGGPGDAVLQYSSFFYNALSETEKNCYMAMYETLKTGEERRTVPNVSAAQAQAAYAALLNDRPDIYWARDYWYGDNGKGVVFQPEYLFTLAERAQAEEQMAAALEMLEQGLDGADDYETARILFERTTQWVSYDETAQNGQTLYGALLERRAVCAGYARLYQYLLCRQGISAIYIEGAMKDGARHAWVEARIDGEWSHFDPTSAKAEEKAIQPGCAPPLCQYAFFGMTDADLTALGYEADKGAAFPAAVSYGNTCYSREGNLLSVYDRAAIEQRVLEAAEGGNNLLALRFLRPEDARAAVEDLFGPPQGVLMILAQVKERVPALDSSHASYTFYPELGCLELYLLQEV